MSSRQKALPVRVSGPLRTLLDRAGQSQARRGRC